MAKLVKLFLIFGPVQGNIKVIKKYANKSGQTIDESLMSTLCLPRIELVNEPEPPRFQTFLVTKEDGQVLYGSGLIVHDRHLEPPPYPGAGRYASYCYTIITDTPFIHATKSLLHLIWAKKCDDIIIKSVLNIPLPARRKCLRIVSPLLTTSNQSLVSNNTTTTTKDHEHNSPSPSSTSSSTSSSSSSSSSSPVHTINTQITEAFKKASLSPKRTKGRQHKNKNNNSNQHDQQQHHRNIDDIYLYRGMTDLPLLDYPLRELFGFLHIDDFLLAYACILMEFRTLIISQDNYKLMMVGETLTSLLLPLKWCNVYVPILPPIYGATYLDAPTSYIMGINTQVTELPENLNHVQCRIYCDESRVVCSVDSLTLPLFLNDLKRDIMQITMDYQQLHSSNTFTYLDDLKFNRAIRILFIKTIRKNILANYERYIVDVPESSAEIRQFDVVSYLSDQPEFMRSFLSKFLDTQLFASFIDENARRIQQSWLSVFDMDPEELSEHFSDKALEQAFQMAHRIHLMDLRQDHPDIEIKTVPASPMKLRRRMPALSGAQFRLASRLTFSASRSTSIEVNNGQPTTLSNVQSITASPPVHRNSVATISLQGQHPLSLESTTAASLRPSKLFQINDNLNDNNNDNPICNAIDNNNSPSSLRPNLAPSSQPVPNGKIIELINEVKDLTKRILIEKMGDPVLDGPIGSGKLNRRMLANGSRGGGNNTLIGSLCDLIERVWAHGAYGSHQDGSSGFCPLWEHLISFTRLKYLDTKSSSVRHETLTDGGGGGGGGHLNLLSAKSERTELDQMLEEPTKKERFNLNNWFKMNRSIGQMGPLARDLINDLKIIHTLKDVKTDIGKARAFIRLALEHKKLSKHLKTLLGEQSLLNGLYKPYAFLRCEDEREQFLMYLLTLNAVDLPCFTTTFVSVIETRRMISNKTTA